MHWTKNLAAMAVAATMAVAIGAEPASADISTDVEGCTQGADIILRIESCTRLIKNGGLEGAELAWAFNNRGLAYEQVKRPERALGDYNMALLNDPDLAVTYNNRGNILAATGDLEGALADHTRAIEIDPNYAEAFYNRGVDHEEMGQFENALADYDRAVQISPEYRIALVSRAGAHCRLGNVEETVVDQMRLMELGHFTAEQLQSYLQERDFYRGAIDGIFGRGSQGALRAWARAGCP